MMVIGLDGKEYKFNFMNKPNRKTSKNHSRAKWLLHELFPFDGISEEVIIPGSRLSIDIYIHARRLAIEIHGEQHYKKNNFFHKTKLDFLNSKKRDAMKKEWCITNNINFVELNHGDTDEQWRNAILRAIQT